MYQFVLDWVWGLSRMHTLLQNSYHIHVQPSTYEMCEVTAVTVWM